MISWLMLSLGKSDHRRLAPLSEGLPCEYRPSNVRDPRTKDVSGHRLRRGAVASGVAAVSRQLRLGRVAPMQDPDCPTHEMDMGRYSRVQRLAPQESRSPLPPSPRR